MPLELSLNGQTRSFDVLAPGCTLDLLIAELGLKADRVAIELNGEIVIRSHWPQAILSNGDKLEMVHFVGGGSSRRHRLY